MTTRDSFQRQTGRLQQQVGTRPLRGSTRPFMDPALLRSTTEEMLEKARQSLSNLEPRIELLLRACHKALLPVPGVSVEAFRHPPSPKGEQIVNYLMGTFGTKPAVAKEVQVAIFRFYEAQRMVLVAEEALTLDELKQTMLEELKLKLFYLSRYHEGFKGDRVLVQLFPAPQTVTGTTAASPQSTVERLKHKQQREAILHKADVLTANFAPKIETLSLTLAMIDESKGLNIGALFTPATRTARLLALGIATNPALVEQLREAKRLYERLVIQLVEARGGGDVEALKETIYPLSQLAISCRQHVLLRDLFPLGEQSHFPSEPSGGPQAGTEASS